MGAEARTYGTYDANGELGLKGANLSYFPYITGLSTVRGGMKDMGSNTLGLSKMEKPSANASMTWVRGKHIFKFGGELRIEGYPSVAEYPAYGSLHFSAEQTVLPSTYGQNPRRRIYRVPLCQFPPGPCGQRRYRSREPAAAGETRCGFLCPGQLEGQPEN